MRLHVPHHRMFGMTIARRSLPFSRHVSALYRAYKRDPKHILARFLRRGLRTLAYYAALPWVRLRVIVGLAPVGDSWFARGQPVHRYYLGQFLARHAADIRGRCLEFQEDSYASRLGGTAIHQLDILHKEREGRASQATIFADLTQPNDIASDTYDCIICTYVLHSVVDVDRMISEMHRILKPGGVLLVAVPNITIEYPQYGELWRFTALGLQLLLRRHFHNGIVETRSYGNSLTAAGELRGLAVNDFSTTEIEYDDPRYGLIVCARAVKST